MSDVLAPRQPLPEALLPPVVSLREAWPWALLAIALLLALYLVAADEGAASLVPGKLLHELVHDGRHLIGAPCH